MTVTLDSSAWIEYFSGSELGAIVKKYVDESETIYTSSITLLEIKSKYMKEGKEWKEQIGFICDRSAIVDVDSDAALLSAEFRNKYRLHTIDAIIYATSRITKTKLVTKDQDFKDLPDVVMLA